MNTITQKILEKSTMLPTALQQEVLDFVSFLQYKQKTCKQDNEQPNGKKIVNLMEQIAKRGTAFKSIQDPVAWQREIRKDRPLPGRK